MDKSVVKNYMYNLLYQITAVLMPIITIPYVSRVLTPEGIGINSYTSANLQYFILLGTFGIALYGNKTIAIVRDDKIKLKYTFWEILSIQVVGCLMSYACFYIILMRNSDLKLYYFLQSIAIISSTIDISWYFVGIEDFKKASLRSFFVKIISVIAIFIFVRNEGDLWKYIFINTVGALLGQIIMWGFVNKDFFELKTLVRFKPFRHVKGVLALFIPQIATQVYTVLDKTMIGIFTGAVVEVGYYDQSQKIVRLSLTIITSLGTVLLPRISNMYANGKGKDIKIFLKKSFNIILLFTIPMALGMAVVSDRFVPIFFGEEYYAVINLIKVSSVLIIIVGAGNVFGTQFLLATGKSKEYTISVVLGAITNVIINIILIPRMGAIGAVIGTILAELVIAIVQGWYSREVIDILWFKESNNYILSGLSMLLITYFIGKGSFTDEYMLLIQIIIGCASYFITLLILKDKLFLQYIKIVKSKFIKK